MKKALLWILAVIASLTVAFFTLGVIVSANESPEHAQAYEVSRKVNDFCETSISDAAPGDDRRMARVMCEELKARAREQLDATR